MTPAAVSVFQEKVWTYYRAHSRDMPWRTEPSPYFVLVSELMLQQTQVSRVIPKFQQFTEQLPSVEKLAVAPLAEVLGLWSGLGYNRRAKFLHEAAQRIMQAGEIPQTLEGLIALPGVGRNTAAAILNYAYEVPTPFVETNIRTVYFHEFPESKELVDDKAVLAFVEATMDKEQPREWFYALMDYGSMLKRDSGGRLDRSRHYKKQSPLRGSGREMRGRILKALSVSGVVDESVLRDAVTADDRFESACSSLVREGLVERLPDGRLCLTGAAEAS